MEDFHGKNAVVTGAASGIGRALAVRCARAGMHLLLADIEAKPLHEVERELASAGARVLSVPTDVSDSSQVDELARVAARELGGVHLLFNNAGVVGGSTLWRSSLADWQWIFGVNVWGVIHGIRAFVPAMIEQGEGHVVNTASVEGLTTGIGIYGVSKHAVVAITEVLHGQLQREGTPVRASVVCPGFVATRLPSAARNRPQGDAAGDDELSDPLVRRRVRELFAGATPPEDVAEHVFAALRRGQFYILPHPEWKYPISIRMRNILRQRTPSERQLPTIGDVIRFGFGNLRRLSAQIKQLVAVGRETEVARKREAPLGSPSRSTSRSSGSRRPQR